MTKQEAREELEHLMKSYKGAEKLVSKRNKHKVKANFVEINIYNRWSAEHVHL